MLPAQLDARVEVGAIERDALDLPLVRVGAAHAVLFGRVEAPLEPLLPHLQDADRAPAVLLARGSEQPLASLVA